MNVLEPERTSVQISVSSNHAEIILSSENGLNILNTDVLREFHRVLDDVEFNDAVKVVTIKSSSAKAFTAGADIVEMETKDASEAREFSELGQSLVRRLETDVPPVIAVLRGYVLGGGLEIACGCDIRIASENCVFSQPEINLGVIPGWGGTQRLARLIGLGKSSELIYLGSKVDALEALEIGLVNRVVPDASLGDFISKIVETFSSMSRKSLLGAKRALRSAIEAPYESGFDVEREEWSSLFETSDQKEGMRAFLERRKPKFKV